MNFVQSFENYLRHSTKRPFVIGDWLGLLPTEQLDELIDLSEKMENSEPMACTVLSELLIKITISETLKKEIDPDLLPGIGMIAQIQKFARMGLVILHQPLSLTGDISFSVTPEALSVHDAILERICKMTMH